MSEMIDITELVRRRDRAERREFLVAVDDALYVQLAAAHRRSCVIDGLPARFVPSSALGQAEHVDLAVGSYVASAPGRRAILHTIENEWIEQDPQGRLFRDGYPLWDAPPVAFGVPRTSHYHALQIGLEAAFFFVNREPDGWTMGTRATAPVLLLLHEPRISPPPVLPGMWLTLAQWALDDADTDEPGTSA